ncbi:MAG: DUF1282 family protein [Lachnospiraceae bacterium]|nr:DUF1282 family protein [Lachnospiraceae bacterium]
MEKVKYLGHILFHPFDGFYEAKVRGKGSLRLATILMVLYAVLKCFSYQYTGFIMNMNPVFEMNSVVIVISALSVPLLFVVANWTVTTLFEGKGKLGEIFMVTSYSMVPLMLGEILVTLVSNFVISEEVVLLTSVKAIMVVWFAFLMIAGLCTIHEYGLFQNLATLVVTLIAAAILIFLFVLFLSLMEQMVSFFITFSQEWVRRT